jgi:ribose transport system substrate-binding protein
VATAQAALKQFEAAPTKINVTTPLKSAPPAGKTLVFLGTNQPQVTLVGQTLATLAGLAHWNYSTVTYDPANPATFTSAVETALTKHANYIAETGTPLTPSLNQKVQAAGAKWVLSSVYPATVAPPVLVATDSYQNDAIMGKTVADFMVADSGGKANAVIEHVPAYPILNGFTTPFMARVKQLCSSCKMTVVNLTIPQLVAGNVPSALVSALRSDPSANYLVFDDGPFADGIQAPLAAAGFAGKVKIIGEAADPAGIAALKSGQQTAWTGFDPKYQGYEMMDSMLRDAEGMPVSQTVEGVQPTQLLTKQNVGSITSWSQPASALTQFKALWHVA